MTKIQQFIGLGRRKTSVARIYMRPNGSGKIIVNKKFTIQEALNRPELIDVALKPLAITKQLTSWDIVIKVFGGGNSGQAGAISLGLSRALLKSDEALRPILRKNDLLSRDPRMVERKKYGQPGARKKFQFSKR